MSVQTKIHSFGGNVGIGTTNPGSYALDVYSGDVTLEAIESTGISVDGIDYRFLPVGSILLWSGGTLPTGWQACDGTNEVPDLRDKFVIGSGSSYNTGQIGGSSTTTLTTSSMPTHSHTITSANSTDHLHTGTVSQINQHTHDFINRAVGQAGTHTHNANVTSATNDSHTHTAQAAAAGNQHTHVGTTNQAGSHRHNDGLGWWNTGTPDLFSNGVAAQQGTGQRASSALYPRSQEGNSNYRWKSQNNAVAHNHNYGLYNTSQTHKHTLTTPQFGHSHQHYSSTTANHTHNVSVANNTSTHTHTKPTLGNSANHTHTISTNSTGNAAAIPVIPPFYALQYIIKIS